MIAARRINHSTRTPTRPWATRGEAILLLALFACDDAESDSRSGTDAGDDGPGDVAWVLREFRVNECKKGTSALQTAVDTGPLTGLQCVAWSRSEGDVTLDLLNFPESCGFGGTSPSTLWRGAGGGDRDSLELDVEWRFEAPSACGACVHDFSFAVAGPGERTSALTLHIRSRSCTVCDWTTYEIALPLHTATAGTICRYPEPPAKPAAAGALYGSADGGCSTGLAPLIMPSERRICAPACDGDSACGSDVLSCQSGACSLNATW
jgi:hypothetical protein